MKTRKEDESFDVVKFLKESSFLEDSVETTKKAVGSQGFVDEYADYFFDLKFDNDDEPSTAFIRFLPNKLNPEDIKDKKSHILTVYQHWFRMLNGDFFVETCPTTIGKKCPVCEYIAPLWQGNDKDKDRYRMLARKPQRFTQIYVVKNVNEPETVGKVFLFKLHKKVMDMVLGRIPPKKELIGTKNSNDELYFDPFNPFKSATFKLKGVREMKPIGRGSQERKRMVVDYAGSVFIEKLTAFPDEKFRKIYDECIDLKEILEWNKYKIRSYDELQKKFQEGMGGNLKISGTETKMETIEDEVDEIEKEFDDDELKKDLEKDGIKFDDDKDELDGVDELEIDKEEDDDIDLTEYLE